MNEENILSLLQDVADQPLLFSLIIILTTFVLEDLATTSAAIITSQTTINAAIPLSALFLGIIIGDIGLYFLGKLSNKVPYFEKYTKTENTLKARALLDKNLIYAIFISRFIPGMRLPTYVAIGALNISLVKFFIIAVFAIALWTSGLFYLFYSIGDAAKELVGNLKWCGFAIIVFLLIFGPKIIQRLIK